MTRERFTFHSNWLAGVDGYPPEQQAEIIFAIVQYCMNGTEPDLSKPYVKMAFMFAKKEIDRHIQLYLNGKRGGAPKGTRNNPNGRHGTNQELTKNKPMVLEGEKENPETERETPLKEREKEIKEKEGDLSAFLSEIPTVPKEKPTFVPPTYEQVKAYFLEKGRPDADPQGFIDYYESVGWTVGSQKKKMTSWKGAVGNWFRHDTNQYNARKHTLLQDDSRIGKFNKLLLKNFPFVVGHMKQLITEAQLNALLKYCTQDQIIDALCALEDRQEYTKKHTNLYLTLYEWLKKDIQKAAINQQ